MIRLLLATAILLLLGAGTAHAAATVTVEGFPETVNITGTLGTESRPSVDCDYFFDGTDDVCVIHDFDGVTSSDCVQDSAMQVTCSGQFGTEHPVRANLGDLDDTFTLVNGHLSVGVRVDAGSGDDVVHSGLGQDSVLLGAGDDWYEGGIGSDTGYGGAGKDTLIGGGSFNVLHGGDGNDTVMSGAWIGTGSSLYGDNGNDYLQGGWANDSLLGGPGDDQLDGGRGGDLHNGGPGFDTVDYDSRTGSIAVTFNGVADDGNASVDDGFGDDLDNVKADVEEVHGGQAADTMVAGALPVVLAGGPGNDILHGGPEADTLLGEDGWDVMRGGTGSDTINGGAGTDEMRYDERSARVAVRLDGLRNDGADPSGNRFSSLTEEADWDLSVERVRSGSAGDYLQGNAAVNLLVGNGGNDDIKSRDGTGASDTVNCGAGTDRFDEDAGDSTFNCETPFVFP